MIDECGYILPDTVDMQIDVLVKNTLDRSVRKHGDKFADGHHAYGVIKEEMEELEEALSYLQNDFEELWTMIRCDAYTLPEIEKMRSSGIHLITEALQVVAMLDKCKMSIESQQEPICKDGVCYVK